MTTSRSRSTHIARYDDSPRRARICPTFQLAKGTPHARTPTPRRSHRRHRRSAGLHVIDFSGREPDPLYVLLDFLVGDSIDTLARKNGLDAPRIESVLRRALAAYGFSGAERASPEPRTAREG